MTQPTGVVGVEMGQNDPAYVGGGEAELLQPWSDLLFCADLFAHPEPEIWLPAREVAGLTHPGG